MGNRFETKERIKRMRQLSFEWFNKFSGFIILVLIGLGGWLLFKLVWFIYWAIKEFFI